MIPKNGDVHGCGCAGYLPKRHFDARPGISGREIVLDVHIGHGAGRIIWLDIDPCFGIGATGIGEVRAIYKYVLPADEAETLAEILICPAEELAAKIRRPR